MAEDAANICRSLGDRREMFGVCESLLFARVGEADALKACAKAAPKSTLHSFFSQVCVQQGDTKSAMQASRQAAAVLCRARLACQEAEANGLAASCFVQFGSAPRR